MISAIGLLACALTLGSAFHLPHDDVHDVACGPSGQGSGVELLIVTNPEAKVLRSLDHGLTWLAVAGEGLETQRAVRVEYWEHQVSPRFWIGTAKGVWAYFPATGEVRAQSAGLGSADLFATEFAVPANNAEAVFMSTKNGKVFAWNEATTTWSPVLETGNSDVFSRVAVTPSYDPAAGPGVDQTLVAGIAGQLHVSDDGGSTWAIHPQFATLATLPTEWNITGLALASDFQSSGTVVVGRGRDNAGTVNGSEGQVWRSTDFGATYAVAYSPISAVREIYPSGPGPSGQRHFFMALEVYPDPAVPQSLIGTLRSDDGGLTWDDFGNWQDGFMDEPDTSVGPTWRRFMGFCASPTFQSDGLIFFGRPESLFRSNDAGDHWDQSSFRSVLHLRGFEVTKDSNGDILAFGAGYGSSTVQANLAAGTSKPLIRNKIPYQNAIDVSPNYAIDGTVLAGGATGIAYWFDPAKLGNNLFGAEGWLFSGKNSFGYVRTIELSPHYDASGTVPGSDLSAFWSTRTSASVPEETWRTLDGGRTAELINDLAGGGSIPFLRHMVIAPTYDSASPAGRTDVYGSAGGYLWRLDDTVWEGVALLPSSVVSLAVDPNFSRPGNPRIFAALENDPHLAEIIDDPGGATVNTFSNGGLTGSITSMSLHPDFANQPVVYISTWGEGIYKMDISAPTPLWQPVGGDYPDTWAQYLRLSPDFLTDNQLIVGGQYGVVVGLDQGGAPWTPIPSEFMIDNIDPGVVVYAPNDPNNTQADRPWPWEHVPLRLAANYGVALVGPSALMTEYDGSYATWNGKGRRFRLETVQGAIMGTVTVTASDFFTGTVLASTTVDLGGGSLSSATIEVDAGSEREVHLRIDAQLDAGERLVLDAITVDP